jgi:FAD/FMN-containing dehydrogenase
VLKLVPRPTELAVALCAVPSPEAALALFTRFHRNDPRRSRRSNTCPGRGWSSFSRISPGTTLPLAERAPHYALIELATPRPNAGLRAAMELVLEAALEAGDVTDAAIAESQAQRAAIWRLREEHTEAQEARRAHR